MTGPSKTAWITSALLHGGMVALLIFGPALRPTVQPVLPGGPIIEAVFVDPKLLDLAPLNEPSGPTRAEIERAERQRLEQEQADRDVLAQQAREKQEEQERQEQIRIENEKKEEARIEAAAKQKEDEDRARKLEDDRIEKERVAKEERDKKEQADKIERERLAAQEIERKEKEEAAQKALAEKKKQEEQEAIAAKKKADELAAKKKEEEEKARLKKIAADKEAARLKKLAEEQERREEEMRRMMGLEDQRNEAVDNGLLAQYIAQIVAKVERNWNRPPSAKDDLSCTVRATQIPGGEVVKVEIGECNGDAVVRRSIENAVNKASPLPEPADSTLFERNLVFIFEPK